MLFFVFFFVRVCECCFYRRTFVLYFILEALVIWSVFFSWLRQCPLFLFVWLVPTSSRICKCLPGTEHTQRKHDSSTRYTQHTSREHHVHSTPHRPTHVPTPSPYLQAAMRAKTTRNPPTTIPTTIITTHSNTWTARNSVLLSTATSATGVSISKTAVDRCCRSWRSSSECRLLLSLPLLILRLPSGNV